MMNETLFSLMALSLSFNNTLANQGDHSIVAFCRVATRLKEHDNLFPGSDQESEEAPLPLLELFLALSLNPWGDPSLGDADIIGDLI